MSGLVITATDTDVGKTVITGALTAAFRQRGYLAMPAKPVASGALQDQQGRLYSEDAEFLRQAAGLNSKETAKIIRYILEPPLTPAVAARATGLTLDAAELVRLCEALLKEYEPVLIEGVGGITAPLWQDYLWVHFMQQLQLPALLVTRPNLGTINHTVLTVEYARAHQVEIKGIIVNGWQEESAGLLEYSNLEYIEQLTALPIVGRFPRLTDPWQLTPPELAQVAEQHLNMQQIMSWIFN